MHDWIQHLAGRFIVFDGPDGSGKSTQFARFAGLCRDAGLTVCEVREPGGTPISEQIREVLLKPTNEDMDLRCEMLLYMASRAQLVAQEIRPALERGELVLTDRFISSTLAYQGTAGGIACDDIVRVGEIAVGATWPDLVVIIDVDESVAASRLAPGGLAPGKRRPAEVIEPTLFSDRMERKGGGFQSDVRRGFLEQAEADPDRYVVVNGAGDPDGVADRVLAAVGARFTPA